MFSDPVRCEEIIELFHWLQFLLAHDGYGVLFTVLF